MVTQPAQTKSLSQWIASTLWMAFGAFLAAFALEIFLIPNKIIDGGIVGISMICGTLLGKEYMPIFFFVFNLPFLYLAFHKIGKSLVIQMFLALLLFSGWVALFDQYPPFSFQGEMLEIIVIGGLMLGMGVGLIIRVGGCLDGTEILAIIINKSHGFTVGQVVLFFNIFIFALAGIAFNDWHSSIYSFMTFVVVIQIMDKVIVGLEETKSVMVVSRETKEIGRQIMETMGLGVTYMYGRGGFSGQETEILYVITERLQLGEIKSLIYSIDPKAFIAIENLHETSNGTHQALARKGIGKKRLLPKAGS